MNYEVGQKLFKVRRGEIFEYEYFSPMKNVNYHILLNSTAQP